MSFVVIPKRLRALLAVAAADVQALYDAIKNVVNGGLDWRNFDRHLDIPNASKDEPTDLTCLRLPIKLPASGSAAAGAMNIPPEYGGYAVTRWQVHGYLPRTVDAGVTWTWDGTLTSNLEFTIYRNQLTEQTAITDSVSLTGASGKMVDRDLTQNVDGNILPPEGWIFLLLNTVTYNNGTGHENAMVYLDLWLKAPHLA